MSAVALTIAGSDSGGGAGIQADLKTFAAFGVFGTSAVTALTAQNTLGVRAVHGVPAEMVAAQIEAVLEDFKVGAIKIGMLFSAEIAEAVASVLEQYAEIPVVLDPVMVATSGDRLMREDAVATIVERLFPRAALITPNLAEAAMIAGRSIASDEIGMMRQGQALIAAGANAVLVKGGHGAGEESIDVLVTLDGCRCFTAPRIATHNTHGTGCTLSSAIAARLALGDALPDSIARAKAYLTDAIAAATDQRLGRGSGPVAHFHMLR